jgi:hypothetical protein
MRGFNWRGYIAASVRHAGVRDQREVQERTHDVLVKLLVGRLFTGFDERTSGPMDRSASAATSPRPRKSVRMGYEAPGFP